MLVKMYRFIIKKEIRFLKVEERSSASFLYLQHYIRKKKLPYFIIFCYFFLLLIFYNVIIITFIIIRWMYSMIHLESVPLIIHSMCVCKRIYTTLNNT